MRSRDEIRQRLVRDDALLNSLARFHKKRFLLPGLQLRFLTEQVQLHLGDLVKSRMVLLRRMAKVFDFRLRKLSHAQQPSSRGDFVPKRLPNLRARERQLPAVKIQQLPKVHKHPLRGFWPQKPLNVPTRPNRRRKHQVKRVRIAQLVLRLWTDAPAPLQRHFHLLFLQLVQSRVQHLKLRFFILPRRWIRDQLLQSIAQQMVRAKTLLRFRVFHHQIRESIDVPARFQHRP